MKKIMFNDKFGLTQAVLEGRKTMTRRMVCTKDVRLPVHLSYDIKTRQFLLYDACLSLVERSRYAFDEVVAIAQSYDCVSGYKCNHDFLIAKGVMSPTHHYLDWGLVDSAGFNNKMFVKAELMPRHIKITNIRVEHLQDISDEDCLREGIGCFSYTFGITEHAKVPILKLFGSPRKAFAALIDKVSGRGTWDSNPLVWVYEFELVD